MTTPVAIRTVIQDERSEFNYVAQPSKDELLRRIALVGTTPLCSLRATHCSRNPRTLRCFAQVATTSISFTPRYASSSAHAVALSRINCKDLTPMYPDNRTADGGAKEASKKARYTAKHTQQPAADPSSEPDTLTIHERRSASSMAATPRRISQTLEEALREQNQGIQIEEHLDLSVIHQTLVRDRDGQGFNPANLQAANPQALADKIASNPEQWFDVCIASTKYIRVQRNELTSINATLIPPKTVSRFWKPTFAMRTSSRKRHSSTTPLLRSRSSTQRSSNLTLLLQKQTKYYDLAGKFFNDVQRLCDESRTQAEAVINQSATDHNSVAKVAKYHRVYEEHNAALHSLQIKVQEHTQQQHASLLEKDQTIDDLEQRLKLQQAHQLPVRPNQQRLESQTQPMTGPITAEHNNLFNMQPSAPRCQERDENCGRGGDLSRDTQEMNNTYDHGKRAGLLPSRRHEWSTSYRRACKDRSLSHGFRRRERITYSPSHYRRNRSPTHATTARTRLTASIRWPDPEHFTGTDRTKYRKWCSDTDAKLAASYANELFDIQVAYVKSRPSL
jgi:hypothetical protein